MYLVGETLTTTEPISWVKLVMGLTGGLALFLIGMERITVSLKAVAGDQLRTILARLSSNRFMGALTGTVVTAVIQSSSVSTVLVVGFVSASLLSVTQAASVIIGANLGTTVTAQVIALDVTEYALGLLASGAIASAIAGRRQVMAEIGATVAGLGFVFLGLDIMSGAMSPLGSYQPFLDLVADSSSPVIGLLLGALFTGLVQSSSATTGVVIVMGSSGLLDLETGIAVILGANIGTAITAVLAALGKSRNAWRAAMVHVLVNVIGAVVWIGLIGILADLATWISGTSEPGVATPQQFANAHTVFNAVNTVVFLVLLSPLVLLTDKLLPSKTGAVVSDRALPAFLDKDLLETPVLALEMARRELLRLGISVRSMFVDSVPAALGGQRVELDEFDELASDIDTLQVAIVSYLGELSGNELSSGQRREYRRLLQMASELQQLRALITNGVVAIGDRRLEGAMTVSDSTKDTIRSLHDAAVDALDDALDALGTGDLDAAKRAVKSKADFREMEAEVRKHLAARLAVDEPRRAGIYMLEIELVEGLRQIHQFARRLARSAQNSSNKAPKTKSGR